MRRLTIRLGRMQVAASSIRGAMVVGFTVVFAVWTFAGYELIRSLGDVERRVASEHAAYAHAAETLSTIRRNVLEASIDVRDALIDAGDIARDSYREDLRLLRGDVDSRMAEYVRNVALHEEKQEWKKLQLALGQYWASLEFVFADDLPTNTTRATTLLRRDVLPIRKDVLSLLDNLKALQRTSQLQHDADVRLLYAQARSRFILVVASALLLGIAAAWFASWHAAGLEREIHRQRTAEIHNRRDLERLSARLVDAQEDERRNLARELHDEVGQALTAIKMALGVALRSGGLQPRVKTALDEARGVAESTLQGVRDLSQLLHPSMLDDFGLPETVSAYVRSFAKRTGIRADFRHDGFDTRLPADVEVCLYRIVQEALTNVARHSGASSCAVSLTLRGDMVEAVVEDSGRGIDALSGSMSDARRGLGLMGMRERAQSLSGRFAISNRTEGGTRVKVSLPVPVSARGERMAG